MEVLVTFNADGLAHRDAPRIGHIDSDKPENKLTFGFVGIAVEKAPSST